MARHGASAILMMSPCVMAQTVPIPGWEIGLAAGSGSIALLLFIYATYLYRRDRRERADIESGNTALTARTTGNSGAGSSVGKAAGTGIRAAAGTGGKAAGTGGKAAGTGANESQLVGTGQAIKSSAQYIRDAVGLAGLAVKESKDITNKVREVGNQAAKPAKPGVTPGAGTAVVNGAALNRARDSSRRATTNRNSAPSRVSGGQSRGGRI